MCSKFCSELIPYNFSINIPETNSRDVPTHEKFENLLFESQLKSVTIKKFEKCSKQLFSINSELLKMLTLLTVSTSTAARSF